MANLETHDIQGIVLSGYFHLKHSNYLFLHMDDPAAAKVWLSRIIPDITSAKYPVGPDGRAVDPPWALNIAFTASGIEALGYAVDTFSQEFREGIVGPDGNRSQRLGDTHLSDPKNWEVGSPETPPGDVVHLCLMVQTKKYGPVDVIEHADEDLVAKCAEQRALLAQYGLREVARAEHGYLPGDGVEHFGFADAISEPDIVGSPKRVQDEQSCVQPGEFILGYKNEYQKLPATPTVAPTRDTHDNLQPEPHAPANPQEPRPKDLGRNGTYMVFRKLHQDVAAWRRYFSENFPPEQMDLMEAKFIGRWHSGAPLALYPDKDPFADDKEGKGRVNNFCYAQNDQAGLGCPIGAHIRRVNPRDSLESDPGESIKSVNRHRILRRGAIYGEKLPPGTIEDDGAGRGVLFLGINSDLKRQFEFIQQTWINRPKFNGLYDESDPVLGNHGDGNDLNNFTIQAESVRRRLAGLPQFVWIRGGAYFFVPSIAALCFFADIKNPRPRG
jgi:Dyp-type peroxidase family